MIERLMNNQLERIWKEAVMVLFKVLSWHLPGGNTENHTKSQSGYMVPGPRLEPRTS
jgi:hypothetical protein